MAPIGSTAFWTVAGSTLAAYGGYRAAGGRHNPELAKATWEKQHRIDFVSDQFASWPAKVEAMFSMLEQESGGNYAAALTGLKLRNVPEPVETAYTQAVQFPSRDGWNRLKKAFLDNPRRQMICKPQRRRTSQCSGPEARVARLPAADRARWAAKSWFPESLTIRTRARCYGSMGSACYGHALFRPGNRILLWQVDRPDLGLYLPCGIGCAAAFGRALRPVWVVAFVLFFVER